MELCILPGRQAYHARDVQDPRLSSAEETKLDRFWLALLCHSVENTQCKPKIINQVIDRIVWSNDSFRFEYRRGPQPYMQDLTTSKNSIIFANAGVVLTQTHVNLTYTIKNHTKSAPVYWQTTNRGNVIRKRPGLTPKKNRLTIFPSIAQSTIGKISRSLLPHKGKPFVQGLILSTDPCTHKM